MNKTILRSAPMTLAVLGGVLGAALAGVNPASASTRAAQTCLGGTIAPGTYDQLTVKGTCTIPSGTVTVQGNLVVAQNAVLDAITPATVIVGGDVIVKRNAVLGLGCGPAANCSVTTNDQVGGNILAEKARTVIVHNTTIGGNVIFRGGGGGVNCTPDPTLNIFTTLTPPPSPPYHDIEDSTVGANLDVSELRSCWFGAFRNQVKGDVLVHNNVFASPDATEIATNTVGGNLDCRRNVPDAQIGDSGGAPNTVSGDKLRECANL